MVWALALLEPLLLERRLALSLQVLREFYVVVTRKIAELLDGETARQILADLGKARLHLPALEDVLAASLLSERHRLAFWDAMVLQSAKALGAKVVWSEDLHPASYGGVRVKNPFA